MHGTMEKTRLNGVDVDAMTAIRDAVAADPGQGQLGFKVRTAWKGQMRSETTIEGYCKGGEQIARRFTIAADEPDELLGSNSAPNPQELLMSAVNACMTVGYVAQASALGITLSQCVIEMEGDIDTRGFFGLDASVPAGYRQLRYTVRLEGDGTRAQYEEIHAGVQATSPNYFNLARPVEMVGTLA